MSQVNNKVVKVASGATAVTLVGGGLVVSGGVAQAAVTTEAALAAAITTANGNAGPDTIEIGAGTIVLTTDLPEITDELTIVGAGQADSIIDGAGYYSAFHAPGGGGTLTVENMTIRNTQADDGPAILSAGNDVVITDVTFADNRAVDYGGAVYFVYNGVGNDLTITGSTFEGNEASFEDGGAVRAKLYGGVVDITDSIFNGNTAPETNGGAVAVWFERGPGVLTIAGSTFTGNSSGFEGGAVYIDAGDGGDSILITDTTFSDNAQTYATGGYGGGAVWIDAYGDVTISDSAFDGNASASGYGGAVYVTVADVTVSNSEFTENYAAYGGGALEAYNVRSLTVQGSTFTGNRSATLGGAIYFNPYDSESSMLIQNSTFTGNSARSGGAVRALGYDGAVNGIENSTFAGNDATYVGGAINHLYGTLVIDQSTITGNTAAYTAGVIQSDGSLEVRNSTITGNEASVYVGGVYVGLYDPSVVASTKRGGRSGKSGSAERADAPQVILEQTATIVNSIIWGNTEGADGDTADLGVNTGEAAVDHSLIGVSNVDVPNAGSGNLFGVENDPLLGALGDNGGDTETMVPGAGSPAIDAGDSAVKSFDTDQRGAARVEGDAIDIGAVEVQPEPVTTTTQAPTTTTTATPTTQGPTTTQGPAVLPPTGGGARTGVLAAMLTGLGAVLTLGATRRRRAD